MKRTVLAPEWAQGIWNGKGLIQVFKLNIDDTLAERIHDGFESAKEAKQARLQTASAVTLLKSLRQRGMEISNPLPIFDADDVVGLVGEVLAKDTMVQRGYEQVFVKFEATGTSKSRGIDLVFRRFDHVWELRLVEAKHLHWAVRGKDKIESPAELRARLSDGLDGFENEGPVLNLAHILNRLLWARFSAKGASAETVDLDNKISFLVSKLEMAEYSVEVVACIDSAYCDNNTLEVAASTMAEREEIGPHDVNMSLLEASGLESFTVEACKKYA